MAMDAAMIERLIKESLPDAQVSIEDLRGDGDHYAAHVVSGAFRGKTRVQQHQMVYQALRGRMGNELHALALQTGAPDVQTVVPVWHAKAGVQVAPTVQLLQTPKEQTLFMPQEVPLPTLELRSLQTDVPVVQEVAPL